MPRKLHTKKSLAKIQRRQAAHVRDRAAARFNGLDLSRELEDGIITVIRQQGPDARFVRRLSGTRTMFDVDIGLETLRVIYNSLTKRLVTVMTAGEQKWA